MSCGDQSQIKPTIEQRFYGGTFVSVPEGKGWNLITELPKLHLNEKGMLFESDPVLGLFLDGTMNVVVCLRDLRGSVEWRLTNMHYHDMTRVIRQWQELPELPENFERG